MTGQSKHTLQFGTRQPNKKRATPFQLDGVALNT